jgi:hypothetical protein
MYIVKRILDSEIFFVEGSFPRARCQLRARDNTLVFLRAPLEDCDDSSNCPSENDDQAMADWFLDAEAIDIHHQRPTEDGHPGVLAAGPDLHQFLVATLCSFFCSLKRANFKWYSKQNPKILKRQVRCCN